MSYLIVLCNCIIYYFVKGVSTSILRLSIVLKIKPARSKGHSWAAGGLEIAEFRGSKVGSPSLVKGVAGIVIF